MMSNENRNRNSVMNGSPQKQKVLSGGLDSNGDWHKTDREEGQTVHTLHRLT